MASVAKGASTARAQGPVCCSYKATEGETEGFRLAAGCWVLGSRQKHANVGVLSSVPPLRSPRAPSGTHV